MAGHCTPERVAGAKAPSPGEAAATVLSDIVLDDLRFQELVSEARTRIARHSPEWTEHNVSDPGITLIELFAWFTDILLYRINRIPERLHLALLELIGVTPAPPRHGARGRSLHAGEPAPGMTIPAGTEVAAPRTAGSGRDRVPDHRVADASRPVSSRRRCSSRRQPIRRCWSASIDRCPGWWSASSSTARPPEDVAGDAIGGVGGVGAGRRLARGECHRTTRPTACGSGAARSRSRCPRRRPPR